MRSDVEPLYELRDEGMHGFLDAVDRYVEATGLAGEVDGATRPVGVAAAGQPTRLDLRAEGIGTVLLATGFRPHHPWLRIPVVGSDGAIQQLRGVTAAPGLYVVGQRFQHRRDSTFIDGARFGAHDVVAHLTSGQPAAEVLREAS